MKKIPLLLLLVAAAFSTKSYGQLSSGVQASFPFAGSTNDISGHDNHGTATGSVTLTTDRFGSTDCAYDFAGDTASYITVPYDTSLEYIGGAMSISLWYKGGTSDFGDFECLFGHRNGTGWKPYSFHLSLFDVNRANFCEYVWEPMETTDTAGSDWHHLVGIFSDDDDTVVLYKDNVLVGSAGSPAFSTAMGDFVIGRLFEGQIDDIVVYNRIVTAAEVDTLYNLPSSCATMGMNAPILSTYKFYPNPSTGLVTIESTDALKGTEVTVHDVIGRMILKKNMANATRNQIDLSEQPDGMYFIKLQNGTEQKTEVLQKIR